MKSSDLNILQDTINSHLERRGIIYRIKLDWFDRQAEIQKVDSNSYELLETIRPREPKADTVKFLSGYLHALTDNEDLQAQEFPKG